MAALEQTKGYMEVLAIPDDRPEMKQANDEFDVVYAQAEIARIMGAATASSSEMARARAGGGLGRAPGEAPCGSAPPQPRWAAGARAWRAAACGSCAYAHADAGKVVVVQ